MAKRLLLFGYNGFIGREIMKKAKEKGYILEGIGKRASRHLNNFLNHKNSKESS